MEGNRQRKERGKRWSFFRKEESHNRESREKYQGIKGIFLKLEIRRGGRQMKFFKPNVWGTVSHVRYTVPNGSESLWGNVIRVKPFFVFELCGWKGRMNRDNQPMHFLLTTIFQSLCLFLAPNSLITKEGVVKLADFGIEMTSYVEDHNATFRGSCVEGSPFWMAPELISVGKATGASDVWSLACTILELITGYPPYFDNSGITALYRMVNDPRPPLPEEMSSELQDFLEKCFKKDPDARPTVRDLLKHSWILKHSKSEKRENWGDTLRKVKTYNTAKREQAIRNIQNVANMDWSQIQQPAPESAPSPSPSPSSNVPNVSGAFGAHNQAIRRQPGSNQPKIQADPGKDKAKNNGSLFSLPGTPTPASPTPENANKLMSMGHNTPVAHLDTSLPKKMENISPLVSATTVSTESRRNFLYSYTVYKIKVTITSPQEQPKSWFIFRSLSDFTDQEEKLKKLPNTPPLPDLPKLKRFGGNDPDYVAYMQQRIEEYLVKLMKIESLHKALIPFLSYDTTLIPPGG